MKTKEDGTRGDRPGAHATPKDRGLRMVSGRLVGPTLNDPSVKQELSSFKAELRKDPEKLRDWYVKSGLLTPGGKLTKKYGG
ncbi:MAG TPA: hypothetical protein VLK85_01715 [Ramlibacter sp.]|nr:hypothetical protein [Ramlibacter sp.]